MTTLPRPTLLLACSLVACSPGTGSTPDPTSSSGSMSGPDTIATAVCRWRSTSTSPRPRPSRPALRYRGPARAMRAMVVPDPDSDGRLRLRPRGSGLPPGSEVQPVRRRVSVDLLRPLAVHTADCPTPNRRARPARCSAICSTAPTSCELGSVCPVPRRPGNGQCHAMCRIDSDPKHRHQLLARRHHVQSTGLSGLQLGLLRPALRPA